MDDGMGALLGVVLVIGMLIGYGTGSLILREEYRSAAIERNYALYCPNTGEFAWKDECE